MIKPMTLTLKKPDLHSHLMFKSKFLRVKCPRCGRFRIIFGKASTNVKCTGCNKLLAKTKGGKAKIKARIEEVL